MQDINRMVREIVFFLMMVFTLGCAARQADPQIPVVLDTIHLPAPADAPTGVVVNARSGYTYVPSRSDYVSVLLSDQVVTTLPVGGQNRAIMAVDEARGWIYIVNQNDDSVTIIQKTDVTATLDLAGSLPKDVAVSPETGQAYILTFYRRRSWDEEAIKEGHLTVVSESEVVEVIPLNQAGAVWVEVDLIGDYVYLGCVGGDVIVFKDLKEVGRHNVGATVTDMDVDPNSGDVYVAARPPGGRELFRFRAGELVESTGVTRKDGDAPTFQVHPTSGDIYMLDHLHHEVIVIRDMEVIERIRVGWHAGQLDIDPLTGNVYVLNTNHNTVTVIHGTEMLVTLDTGWYPYGIDINPTNGRVYITNSADDTITVLGFEEE